MYTNGDVFRGRWGGVGGEDVCVSHSIPSVDYRTCRRARTIDVRRHLPSGVSLPPLDLVDRSYGWTRLPGPDQTISSPSFFLPPFSCATLFFSAISLFVMQMLLSTDLDIYIYQRRMRKLKKSGVASSRRRSGMARMRRRSRTCRPMAVASSFVCTGTSPPSLARTSPPSA